ncbi:MAG TPA: Ig-like domain-containing protein [Anaerolineaceae bacterium]|nr:Ig-like domain-containing protein [Anaerolineaceae bacterium]
MAPCLSSDHRSSPFFHFARPAGRALFALALLAVLFLRAPLVSAQGPSGAGSALYFDGAEDYVTIADDGSGAIDFGSGDFTVEMWVQRLNTAQRANLFERNSAGTTMAIFLAEDNKVYFDLHQAGFTSAGLASSDVIGTGWTHIACVRQGNTLAIYINGRSNGSVTPPHKHNFDSNASIWLGYNANIYGFWLQGAMDELRIWRVARSQADIQQNMYRTLSSSEPGMAAYYRFDGAGADAVLSSADGNPSLTGQLAGTFSFSPSPWRTSGAFSGPGRAMLFDGSNDLIDVSHQPGLQPAEYTIEAWIYRTGTGTSTGLSPFRTAVCKGLSTEHFQLAFVGSGTQLNKAAFTLHNGTARQAIYSQTSIITFRWYHLAATYSAASGGTMQLYVDGVLEASLTGVGTPVNNTDPLRIGGTNGLGYFSGQIDEVRIWNRARTAEEIRDTLARTLTGSEANLAAYYRFDQGLHTANLTNQPLYDWGPSRWHGASTGISASDATWPTSAAFNTWLGGQSNDWASAFNWSRGAVPADSDTVGVVAGSTYAPVLAANGAAGHVVIGSGAALSASGAPTLTVKGNWFNQGAFVPASSMVQLAGDNRLLGGSTTFYNLSKTAAYADTLTFPAGATQTVTGALTLRGSSPAARLALRSNQPGTQWRLDPQGTRTVANLNVQDSANVHAVPIPAGSTGSLDSGNNTGWNFAGLPPVIAQGATASVTLSEDGAPTPFSLALTASDPEGDPLTWSLASPAAHGTAAASGTGASPTLSYTPAPDYFGPDSFVVAVSDKDGAATITVNLTVQAVDDPPVLTVSGARAFTEGDPALVIAPDLTLTDTDGPNLTGVKVSIGAYRPDEDYLDYSTTNGVSGSFNPATGVLTLSGDRPVADYQAALRTVRYRNSSQTPNPTPRTIAFSISQASLYNPDNEHFYQFVSAPGITWSEAKTRAESRASYGQAGYPSGVYGLQGYLATIASAGENQFLTDKVSGSAWIGASDAAAEGVWRWVTGPEAGGQFWQGLGSATGGYSIGGLYTNWNGTGEPNDSGTGGEDYAHMMSWTSPAGQWNDLPDAGGTGQYASTGYMVEYGGMPGDPSLHLTGEVTVSVGAVNDLPVFSGSPTVNLVEDQSSFTDLSPMFSDPDGNPLAYAIFVGPDHGSASMMGTWLRYNPAANYHGTDSLTVRASDGQGGVVDVVFDLVITAVNDAPDSANGAATIDEDTLYLFSAADFSFSDIDGDALHSVEIRTLPAAGTLFLDANTNDTPDGGEAVSASQAILAADLTRLKFQPAADASGAPYTGFDFRVSDGAAFSGDRSFAIHVTPVNDPPVFSGSSPYAVTLVEDNPYTDNLSELFSDADGDPLSFEITADPASGSAGLSADGVTGDQILTYQPDANANGSDSLTITVSDGQGGSLAVVFALTITSVNDAPATQDRSVSLEEDAQYTFSPVDFSFTDLDGDALHAVQVLSVAGGGVFFLDANANSAADAGEAVSANQVIAAAELTRLTFQPAADANGSMYAGFNFRVSDGDAYSPAAALSIDVAAVNDAPQISCAGACAQSGAEDADLVLTGLSVADVDAGDGALTVTLTVQYGTLSAPAGLPGGSAAGSGTTTLTLSGPLSAINTGFASGSVLYRGDLDFNGSDTLTVGVNDNGATGAGGAQTDDTTVPLTLTAINDAPASADSAITLAEDGLYVFSAADFPFTDIESAALHAVQIRSLPDAGTLFRDADGDDSADMGEAVAVDALILAGELGELKFRPAVNAFGDPYAAFDFRVSDGTDPSGDYTLTIAVTSVNDAPVFSGSAAVTLVEDQSASTNLAALFSDADGDPLSYDILSGPAHGAATLDGAALVYTPAANYHGADSLTVRAADGQGGTLEITFTLTVTPANDPPTAADGAGTIAEDGRYTFAAADFAFADLDGDALHSVEILSLPEAGTLFLDADADDAPGAGEAVAANQVIVAADLSSLKFRPAADAHGSPYAAFTFRVGDGALWSDPPNTLTIHVDSVNDAPVIAGTPAVTVAAESAYSFTPTAADTDDDPLTFAVANQPAWASFDPATGALSGTPANSDSGTTTGIAITVSDGQGGSASLPAFDLTVTFTNHPPVAAGAIPAQVIAAGAAFDYTLPLTLFTDSDEQALTVSAALAGGDPLPAWLSFDPTTLTFRGSPGASDAGTLFVTVTAADPYGAQAEVTFSLSVNALENHAPLLAIPVLTQFGAEGGSFAFTLPAETFYDPDGDALLYYAQLAGGQPLPDWLTLDLDQGAFLGTPPATGAWSIQLTAYDGRGGSALTTFELIVPEGNSPPYLQKLIPDLAATAGTAFTFTLDLETFVDPNWDRVLYHVTLADGQPLPDWLSFDPETLTFRGTPPAGQPGLLLVRVTVAEEVLKDQLTASAVEGPASDLFLIAVSDAVTAYRPVNITGIETDFNGSQVRLPAGLLPAHPHYALQIDTTAAAPAVPAGWVSLEHARRVAVVDANGDPVTLAGSATVCFPLSAGDWVLGNGEARNFTLASAASASGSWRLLETVTDSDRRTACAEAPFGLVDLLVPEIPDPAPAALPATGFAPNAVTPLPVQSPEQDYDELGGVWVEIPRLGVQAEIVGVPYNTLSAWDVTWLGARAGWLESTAFPTWAGNSVLAAHATTAGGRPGLFARLGELRYGDQIIVRLFGQRYVYEVRSVDLFTKPDDTRAMRHEELPWLTLVTCRGYDEQSGTYRWRTVVRAVQVSIEDN